MKNFIEGLKKIAQEQKSLLIIMVILFVLSISLFIYSLVTLNPNSIVTKVGYSDIGRYQGGGWKQVQATGGYVDGKWGTMLAYPMIALIIGVIHNIIIAKIYTRKGPGVAMLFAIISILLVLGIMATLMRLVGEG